MKQRMGFAIPTRSTVEPYIADPPDTGDYSDHPTELTVGWSTGFTEYSADFRKSAEYKKLRAEAKMRGKLGF